MKNKALLIYMLPVCLMTWPEVLSAVDHVPTRTAKFISSQKGNIFTENAGQLDLRIEPAGQVAAGNVEIRDENGAILKELPVEKGTSSLIINLSDRGFYRLKATVIYEDKTSVTAQTTAAVVGPLLNENERLNSRFGNWRVHADEAFGIAAGCGLNRYMTSLKDYKIEVLQQDNIHVEEKNPPDFQKIGTLAFGLPLWLISLPPEFKQEGFFHPFQPPKDWLQLEKLVQTFAMNPPWGWFPGYLEIYNEPENNWKGSDEDLIKFHSTVARAIKSVRPGTKLLGPCMATIKLDLFKKYVALGLLECLDGLSFHPYANAAPESNEFIGNVIELQDYLKSIGKENLPIFFTEFGWTTSFGNACWNQVDEITQARYASRSLTLLASRGIDGIIYFCMLFKIPEAPDQGGFSVLNYDTTPKPAYASFANTVHWLTGVDKKGKWLKITPSANLVLFRKHEALVAVAWDAAGDSAVYLPRPWGKMQTMTGKAIVPKDAAMTAISPSPIFVEVKDTAFFDLKILPPAQAMRGQEISVPADWNQCYAPPPLTITGQKVRVPSDAPLGRYLLIGKKTPAWLGRYLLMGKHTDTWEGLPVEVISPIAIVSAEIQWPLHKTPVLTASIRSFLGRSVNVRPILKMDHLPDEFYAPITVRSGQSATLSVPLNSLSYGKRYQGCLLIESRWENRYDFVKYPLDITLLPCAARARGNSLTDEQAPWLDFTGSSNPFPVSGMALDDCSGKIKAAYNESGLTLLVKIRDNKHVQTQVPAGMWHEDSLQIAFDADAAKPWEANAGVLFNGHRVTEYGVAARNGDVMVWRWLAHAPGLSANSPEPAIRAKTHRRGDETIYEIFFPWHVLGLNEPPKAGGRLGFSLTVNDSDGDAKGRHGICLFGGIMDKQDPREYGSLWLR